MSCVAVQYFSAVYDFVVVLTVKPKPVEQSTYTVLSALDLVKGSSTYKFGSRFKRRSIRYILNPSLRKDQTINSSVGNKNIFFKKKTSFLSHVYFAKKQVFFFFFLKRVFFYKKTSFKKKRFTSLATTQVQSDF